jgi:hypothetical protein
MRVLRRCGGGELLESCARHVEHASLLLIDPNGHLSHGTVSSGWLSIVDAREVDRDENSAALLTSCRVRAIRA